MNHRKLVPTFIACALMLTTIVRAELKVGDAAPALHVQKWLNGEPVEKFEAGKVYVIECWATWCGPCVAAIPHVSELQTKYKDKGLTVIGLNVWEGNPAKVEQFVTKMGDKMNYVVAIDAGGREGESAVAWLKAAGVSGIPTSFVVDQKGRIAWFGHPMEMQPVLDQVLAGNFDAAAYAKQQEQVEALGQQLNTAAQAGDWDKALKVVDEMAKLSPMLASRMDVIRFHILLQEKHDYDAAYTQAKSLLEGSAKDDAAALNEVSWAILAAEGVEKRDLPLAQKIAERANELTESKQPQVLDTLAKAHFDQGHVDLAIEHMTAAVKLADDPDLKKQLQETLDTYHAAKK